MPKKRSKQPYKPKREYRYTVRDVAEAAGITRNALGVAKARGKVDPGNFKSMVSFLTRVIIERRLRGNLFAPAAERIKGKKAKRGTRTRVGKKSKKPSQRK